MIKDCVANYAKLTPSSLACIDLESGQRWTYQAFDKVINQVAHYLVSELGPRSQKRVAVIAENSATILILHLACSRAGAIFVPINWRLAKAEIHTILHDAEPSILFAQAGFDPECKSIKAKMFGSLLLVCERYPESRPVGASVAVNETTLLLYTSGTSGLPKGVKISEQNIYWGLIAYNSVNKNNDKYVFLCDMPLFHTAGLLNTARGPLLLGGTVIISRGFNPAITLSRLADPSLAVSHYFCVPQMAERLWKHPDFKPESLSNLQMLSTGGAPINKSLVERFLRAGIPLSNGFGMTETGAVSGNPVFNREQLLSKLGSAGTLYKGVEAKVVDDQGQELAYNQVGELWVRGPGVTSGYWRDETATASAFSGDWFKSGDLSFFDKDGYLTVVDRKKNMYISGGENVYSAEVEMTIAELPDVEAVAVFGVPDQRWGEVGAAMVILRANRLNEIGIRQHCENRLARYKLPKFVRIVTSLPYTSTGKVKKRELKQTFLKELMA